MVKYFQLLSLTIVLIIFTSVSVYSQINESSMESLMESFIDKDSLSVDFTIDSLIYHYKDNMKFVIEDDGSLLYKDVFDFEEGVSRDEIISYFKLLPSFNFRSMYDGDLIGQFEIIKLRYSQIFGNIFENDYYLEADVRIQFKENRYRVILTDMMIWDSEYGYGSKSYLSYQITKGGVFIDEDYWFMYLLFWEIQFSELFKVKSEEVDW